MKSLANLANQPVGIPLLADDVLEFHAARLLLLLRLCGKSGRIEGLTKMAKLDFFVRYPQFFEFACKKLGMEVSVSVRQVESSMIKFHYGPWDHRYYHILSYLEAKDLVSITANGNMYQLKLTEQGSEAAGFLATDSAFLNVARHMKEVKKALGNKSGSRLKKLVYEIFKDEVAKRSIGEVID